MMFVTLPCLGSMKPFSLMEHAISTYLLGLPPAKSPLIDGEIGPLCCTNSKSNAVDVGVLHLLAKKLSELHGLIAR